VCSDVTQPEPSSAVEQNRGSVVRQKDIGDAGNNRGQLFGAFSELSFDFP